MNQFHTYFDRANKRVGFAPFACPEPEFAWFVGSWGACDKPAGKCGTATRTINCAEVGTNSTVPNSWCTMPMPDTTESCNCLSAAPHAQLHSLTLLVCLLAALAMLAFKH